MLKAMENLEIKNKRAKIKKITRGLENSKIEKMSQKIEQKHKEIETRTEKALRGLIQKVQSLT